MSVQRIAQVSLEAAEGVLTGSVSVPTANAVAQNVGNIVRMAYLELLSRKLDFGLTTPNQPTNLR